MAVGCSVWLAQRRRSPRPQTKSVLSPLEHSGLIHFAGATTFIGLWPSIPKLSSRTASLRDFLLGTTDTKPDRFWPLQTFATLPSSLTSVRIGKSFSG